MGLGYCVWNKENPWFKSNSASCQQIPVHSPDYNRSQFLINCTLLLQISVTCDLWIPRHHGEHYIHGDSLLSSGRTARGRKHSGRGSSSAILHLGSRRASCFAALIPYEQFPLILYTGVLDKTKFGQYTGLLLIKTTNPVLRPHL